MTDILTTSIFSPQKSTLNQISLNNFFSDGPIGNNLALIQMMTWCKIDYKSLSKPMMTLFNDV